VSRRLSPQETFDRLLTYYNGWVVCEKLNTALRKGLGLYCDGVLLNLTDILAHGLYVDVEPLQEDHWRCTIGRGTYVARLPVLEVDDSDVMQRVTVVIPPEPKWEFEAEDIEILMPPLPSGPGAKSSQNWTRVVDRELLRLQRIGSPLLESLEKLEPLYTHMVGHLAEEIERPHYRPTRLRTRLRNFLKSRTSHN
jgi:hypothetical protein